MAELRALETRATLIEADVIEKLEACLSKARRGEICAVGVAFVYSDRHSIGTSYSRTDQFFTLLGAVANLQNRMLSEKDES